MVGLIFLVQVADVSDVGRVAFLLCPHVLLFRFSEHAIGVILDDVVVNGTAFLPAFRARSTQTTSWVSSSVHLRHLGPPQTYVLLDRRQTRHSI
jgi:hypothetical protein